MKPASKAVVKELKRIALSNDGLLMPKIVVEAARAKSSPLHRQFEWDDSKAAEKYRLDQARHLIRVSVELIDGVDTPVDVFVSLTPDRGEKGGYRIMTQVLSDAEMRQQLLSDAISELGVFREKYNRLKELAEVFKAIRKVKRR